MTSSDLRGPRHAASVTPHAPVDTPAQALPVIPAQRTQEVLPSAPSGADGRSAAFPVQLPSLPPTPPAGLAVGHPSVPGRSRLPIALVAVVATLVLFGLMVAAGLAITSSEDEPSTGSSGATPAAASSTPQQELAQWTLGGGTTRTRAITDDLNAVSDAASRYDVTGMNSACRSLQSSIEAAQAYDPVPDAQAQASWSSALAHGARSATYCIAGTASMSAPLIESSTSEITNMTADLNRTTDRINAINSGI